MYGILRVIKTIGFRPKFKVFQLGSGEPIPNLDDWLMEHIGKKVSIYVSDKYFQIVDTEVEL